MSLTKTREVSKINSPVTSLRPTAGCLNVASTVPPPISWKASLSNSNGGSSRKMMLDAVKRPVVEPLPVSGIVTPGLARGERGQEGTM
jgi:hypothetical protein